MWRTGLRRLSGRRKSERSKRYVEVEQSESGGRLEVEKKALGEEELRELVERVKREEEELFRREDEEWEREREEEGGDE